LQKSIIQGSEMEEGTENKDVRKPANSYKAKGWADVVLNLGNLIIQRGLLIPAGTILIILLMVWKLNSKDLADVLTQIVGRVWLGVAGWVVALIVVYVSIRIYKAKDRAHREEIARIAEVKNFAIQKSLNLNLPPPKEEK
jgi:hypothetical protein